MVTLKKYNLNGNEIGQVHVDDAFVEAEANGQMVKDYIIAIRENARQWSANTKTRAEVNHSTKKPHPQKGGGRSRQGMLSAPQYKGGGRVFGPKPKFDQHVRINKKERKAAIRFLIGEKIRNNQMRLIETTELSAPATKIVAGFLNACGIKRRTLFLGEGQYAEFADGDKTSIVSTQCTKHDNFMLSTRNIPKTEFSLAMNISGYDIMVAHEIILTEPAFNELKQWLC
ncbi:MAG: 50S ribosomal protein L4 [Parachlamydiaceae bacterium]